MLRQMNQALDLPFFELCEAATHAKRQHSYSRGGVHMSVHNSNSPPPQCASSPISSVALSGAGGNSALPPPFPILAGRKLSKTAHHHNGHNNNTIYSTLFATAQGEGGNDVGFRHIGTGASETESSTGGYYSTHSNRHRRHSSATIHDSRGREHSADGDVNTDGSFSAAGGTLDTIDGGEVEQRQEDHHIIGLLPVLSAAHQHPFVEWRNTNGTLTGCAGDHPPALQCHPLYSAHFPVRAQVSSSMGEGSFAPPRSPSPLTYSGVGIAGGGGCDVGWSGKSNAMSRSSSLNHHNDKRSGKAVSALTGLDVMGNSGGEKEAVASPQSGMNAINGVPPPQLLGSICHHPHHPCYQGSTVSAMNNVPTVSSAAFYHAVPRSHSLSAPAGGGTLSWPPYHTSRRASHAKGDTNGGGLIFLSTLSPSSVVPPSNRLVAVCDHHPSVASHNCIGMPTVLRGAGGGSMSSYHQGSTATEESSSPLYDVPNTTGSTQARVSGRTNSFSANQVNSNTIYDAFPSSPLGVSGCHTPASAAGCFITISDTQESRALNPDDAQDCGVVIGKREGEGSKGALPTVLAVTRLNVRERGGSNAEVPSPYRNELVTRHAVDVKEGCEAVPDGPGDAQARSVLISNVPTRKRHSLPSVPMPSFQLPDPSSSASVASNSALPMNCQGRKRSGQRTRSVSRRGGVGEESGGGVARSAVDRGASLVVTPISYYLGPTEQCAHSPQNANFSYYSGASGNGGVFGAGGGGGVGFSFSDDTCTRYSDCSRQNTNSLQSTPHGLRAVKSANAPHCHRCPSLLAAPNNYNSVLLMIDDDMPPEYFMRTQRGGQRPLNDAPQRYDGSAPHAASAIPQNAEAMDAAQKLPRLVGTAERGPEGCGHHRGDAPSDSPAVTSIPVHLCVVASSSSVHSYVGEQSSTSIGGGERGGESFSLSPQQQPLVTTMPGGIGESDDATAACVFSNPFEGGNKHMASSHEGVPFVHLFPPHISGDDEVTSGGGRPSSFTHSLSNSNNNKCRRRSNTAVPPPFSRTFSSTHSETKTVVPHRNENGNFTVYADEDVMALPHPPLPAMPSLLRLGSISPILASYAAK